MTLLVARQCRLLRAPQSAVGALCRLQRSAVTIITRSYADEAQASNSSEKLYRSKKVDLTEYRKHQSERTRKHTSRYPITPAYEQSDIVSVNSATLIPASVAATVSALTVQV